MIVDMIATFLLSQVGQTLTREAANGVVLLVNAAVTHHAETAVAADRAASELTQSPR